MTAAAIEAATYPAPVADNLSNMRCPLCRRETVPLDLLGLLIAESGRGAHRPNSSPPWPPPAGVRVYPSVRRLHINWHRIQGSRPTTCTLVGGAACGTVFYDSVDAMFRRA